MKNPERLIGKKVYGFKFENSPNIKFDLRMLDYVGKIGIIDEYRPVSKNFKVEFEDGEYWGYPADQIEDHLVEDEIPTFTKEDLRVAYKSGFNLVKRNKECDGHFERWYQKKYEPTKEEQLTAILGSSEKVSEIMEFFKKD